MLKEYKERPTDFTRQIIAEGDLDDVRKLEVMILKSVNAKINEDFYNKHNNDGFYFDGWKSEDMTEEHRKNMSIASKKRLRSREHIIALNEGRRKSKNSDDHNRRVTEAREALTVAGYYQSDEFRKKICDGLKKADPEIIRARSIKGGRASAEKYRNSPKRQKQHSERMKRWWADRKNNGGMV